MMNMFASDYVLVDGIFEPDDLLVEVAPLNRKLMPEVESMIEKGWTSLLANPSTSHFYDGKLWRYVDHHCLDGKIKLFVEPTAFKTYKGTNIDHPEFLQQYGENVMANPLVVVAMTKTADNCLLFGRRSEKVALFQNQIHLVGGSVSRKKETLTGADIFQAMRDELIEETGVQEDEIVSLKCTGLRLHMPYRNRAIAFRAGIEITAAELEKRVGIDSYEHDEFIFVPDRASALAKFAKQYKKEISLPAWCWIVWRLGMQQLFERG